MCWSGSIYLLFYPGWCRCCRPVSRSIFALTPSSSACAVPTCTYFPRPVLPFRTRPANLVATIVLVCKSTPPSMGQFRGVFNRHIRTSKNSPYLPKLLPFSHQICLCPQFGNNFRTQSKKKGGRPCQERWWGSGNLEFIRDRSSESLVQFHFSE